MTYFFGAPSWKPALLQDLVFLQRGFDITKANQREGIVPVFSSSGINSYHDTEKISGPGIIIGRKGTLGSVFFSEGGYWPHDTTLWSKDLKGNDPKFVFYAMKIMRFERFDVGAANPTLNRNHIHSLPIRLPDIDTQKIIASTLSAYDDLIENNQRRIALLEDAARHLYKEWFVRFRFPGHEHIKIVDGVPEGWERTTAADVMDILSGGTPKTTIDEFWGGDIPFYTPKDSSESIYVMETEKTLTERGLSICASKLYPKNTLFITARGTVGKLNLAQTPMAMNQSCYALVGRGAVTQAFLYFSLNAGIDQLKSRAVGAVFDAIIKDTFNTIPYLLPTTALIRDFSEIVEPNLRQVDVLLNQNRLLAQARNLLLPKLMNGEITV